MSLLLFAGSEHKNVKRALIKMGVKHVLCSYWYLVRRKVDIEEMFEDFETVVIDSGAFTMGAGHGKGSVIDLPLAQHEEYLERYLAFLYKHAGRFYWAANYDLDTMLGHNLILDWNLKFENLEKSTGQRVCYVTHDRSQQYPNMKRYFDRYDFIGLSGDHKQRKNFVGYFGQAYKLAMDYGKLCHGFALTSFVSGIVRNYPMFSVDSTTYLGGIKFGSTYNFNGAYFETWDYNQKYRRKTTRNKCDTLGIDFDLFVGDDNQAVLEWNIAAWLENEKLYNRITKAKQWWLSNERGI